MWLVNKLDSMLQLEDTKKEGLANEEEPQKENLADEEHGIEMDEDFEGALHDLGGEGKTMFSAQFLRCSEHL